MNKQDDDIYGMKGLLKAIQENDSLVLGHDLNKLGLDFGTRSKYLYKTFSGPWGTQMSVVDLKVDAPSEYRNVSLIRNKLPDLKLAHLSDDVLFYIFYNFPGDVYQIAAGVELNKRKWRYHKLRKMWLISPLPLDVPENSVGDLGECLCYMFDPIKWRKETQTIYLRMDDLQMSVDFQPNAKNLSSMLASSNSSQQNSFAAAPPMPISKEKNFSSMRPGSSLAMEQPTRQSESMFGIPAKCVLQLSKIAQGMAISKQEVRLLTSHLSENPEIFAQMDNGNGKNGNQFLTFIQREPEIAGVLLVYQLMYNSTEFFSNLDILLSMNVDTQILLAVNKFVKLCEFKALPIPHDFLNKFISMCIANCERDPTIQDEIASHRLVRMICIFLEALLGLRHFDPTRMRAEIQNFAISYLALREASQLYQKTLQL